MSELASAVDLVAAVHAGQDADAAAREAEARAEADDRNAFLHVGRTPAGSTGPLAGVPVALKDNLCQRDTPTTCASKLLEDWVAPYDATAVARVRAAGAALVGKTNMDEFGMGSSTEHSAFGPALHPRDDERVPGGSSGGSACAVARGVVPVALGTDTGGSVRQPAAFCGVFGLKPTYGAVSRYGLVAFGSSLDVVGPLARTARDAARVFDVIAGHDPRDATSLRAPHALTEPGCDDSPRGLRVGVPEALLEGATDEVRAAFDAALARLRAEGAEVVPVDLPHAKLSVSVYYVLATAEASSNLARFDGGRYGLRVAGRDPGAMVRATRAHFGAEVKRRILLGTFALSAGYHDRYYGQAQRVRRAIARDYAAAFSDCDVVATPTAPTVAFRRGEHADDPLAMYLADLYTLPASLAGLPALSAPAPVASGGLPVGVQFVAPARQERTLFALGARFEAAS